MTPSLHEFLSRAVIDTAVAMPMGIVTGFYLDLVLTGQGSSIRISASAADMPDRTEAFYLTARPFDPHLKWAGPNDEPAWDLEDLRRSDQTRLLFLGSRAVRYYFDPADRIRGLVPMEGLDAAAAIEFSPTREEDTFRLVLYATPEYPCSIEIVLDARRAGEILIGLQEFCPTLIELP